MTSGIEKEAEPVAWLWTRGGDLDLTLLRDGDYGKRLLASGFTAQPLYAHHATAPAVPVEGAPDRIWAWEGDGQDGWDNAYATTHHVANDQVEYVRADIALYAQPAPQVKALEEALEESKMHHAQAFSAGYEAGQEASGQRVKTIAEAAIRDCAAGMPISAANLARDILSALSGEEQR